MNKKVIIGIISAVVALCIVITGVIYLLASEFSFKNPEKDDKESQVTNSTTENVESANTGVTSEDASAQNNSTAQNNTSGNKNEASSNTPTGSIAENEGNNSTDNSSEATQSSPTESTNSTAAKDATIIDENAPDKAAFYIPKMKAAKGDKIKVPVKVTKNPGFMAFQISFSYDKSALKYTGYSKGELVTPSMISETNGTVKLQVIENGDVKKDGTVIYLEFEVISDKAQDSEIKINLTDKSFANYSEQYVVFAAQNGSVAIK